MATSRPTSGHNATRTQRLSLLAPSTQLALCEAQPTARQDLVQLLSLSAWGHMQAGRQTEGAGEQQGVFICPMVCLCCQWSIIIVFYSSSHFLSFFFFFSLHSTKGLKNTSLKYKIVDTECAEILPLCTTLTLSKLLFRSELHAGSDTYSFKRLMLVSVT